LATSVAPLTRRLHWRVHPLEQTGPISAQAVRGSGGPVPLAFSQTERIQDWHSLDRHADMRVNLADHAENASCSLLAGPKISGRTQPAGSGVVVFLAYSTLACGSNGYAHPRVRVFRPHEPCVIIVATQIRLSKRGSDHAEPSFCRDDSGTVHCYFQPLLVDVGRRG